MKRKKQFGRSIAFLLTVMMLVTMLPMAAFAGEQDNINVFVTISTEGMFALNKDGTGMVRVPIPLPANATAVDALLAAHRQFYEDGEDGYEISETKAFSKFWGNETMNVGYFVNGKMVMDASTVLTNGDDIEGTVYKDYYTDYYARFNQQAAIVTTGEAITLTLLQNRIMDGPNGMMGGESADKPLAGATILVGDDIVSNVPWDDSAKWVTDDKGKVKISFENLGTYYVSAQKEGSSIIPPICKVTVVPTDEEKAQIIKNDKDALTFDSIKGENTTIDGVIKKLRLPVMGASGATMIYWSSNNESVIKNDGTVIRPVSGDQTVQLTATISCGNQSDTKTFGLTVSAVDDTKGLLGLKELAGKIAANYASKDVKWWNQSAEWWHATGMNAYNNVFSDEKSHISEEAKQAFVNKSIDQLVSLSKQESESIQASVKANQLANTIHAMSAFGYDATSLWTVNKIELNAVSQLKKIEIEEAKKGWYMTIAPYVLLSLQQGEYNSEKQETEHINYLLEQLQAPDWSFGVDTPAMLLQGLAPYYERENVKPVVDGIIDELSKRQGENGSCGSATGDAAVIIALAQLGINPDTDTRFVKSSKSLLDGLLSYQADSGNGFFYKPQTYDEYATKQGFLALIAAQKVMETGKAYNVYDFSGTKKSPVYANGSGGEEKPADPIEEKEITVYFTLKSDSGTWISKTPVTVKADATVYHAFTTVLDDKGFTYEGANRGYITSITNKSGKTLEEFSKGPNSGWLYMVNGELPLVGLTKHHLSDRDHIVYYFTEDWTEDEKAVEAAGGKSNIEIIEETVKGSAIGQTEVQASIDKNNHATVFVSDEQINDVINKVVEATEKAKNQKKEVKIIVKADRKAVSVETKLSQKSLLQLKKNVDVLMIQTPIAEMNLSKENLSNITANMNGDLKLSVAKVDFKQINMEKINNIEVEKEIANRPILDFQLSVGDKAISNFEDSVQVSVPYIPSKNENVNSLIIYYINDNDQIEKMKDCYYDAKAKAVMFSTEHFSMYAVGYKEVVLQDIAKHWAKDSIIYLAARDIVGGKSNHAFAPDDNITRAEFAQILYGMADPQNIDGVKAAETFNDVKAADWYAKAVTWAYENGVVKGLKATDGTINFAPNAKITRQDMAVMIQNYQSKVVKKEFAAIKKEIAFSDQQKIADYAKTAVSQLQKSGVINGKTATTFRPKDNATRAESAIIISAVMKNNIE